MSTVILKNTTTSQIVINDLAGMRLPAEGQYEATIARTVDELKESADLYGYLQSGDVVWNQDTQDLTSQEITSEIEASESADGFVPVFKFSKDDTVSTSNIQTLLPSGEMSNTKLNLQASDLPLGTYILEVSFGFNSNDTGDNFESQVWDAIADEQLGELHVQEVKDSGGGSWEGTATDQRYYIKRRFILENISGDVNYRLNWRPEGGNFITGIFSALMTLERKPV